MFTHTYLSPNYTINSLFQLLHTTTKQQNPAEVLVKQEKHIRSKYRELLNINRLTSLNIDLKLYFRLWVLAHQMKTKINEKTV